MKDKLYLATSVFKYYGDDNRFIFKVIQPLFGTYDKKTKKFTNFNKREYYEILDKHILESDERIGFYNLTKLVDLEEKYGTDDLEVIVEKYFLEHKDDGYEYNGISLVTFDYTSVKALLEQYEQYKKNNPQ